MKDDYLWDKSGEPDAEIEHLERVLSPLRSKRTAQELLPAFDKLPRKRAGTLTKALAVAAALAFALLALGAYAALQRQSKKQDAGNPQLVMANPVELEPSVKDDATASGAGESKPVEGDPSITVTVPFVKRSPLEARRRSINRRREAVINERAQSEGLMAKEQLLKALEITSSKLDFVQKKVKGDEKQGPSS